MKITTVLTVILCSQFFPAIAQEEMFLDALEEFSTRKLWEFESIPVEWKMKGVLQADLNDGLNHLLEGNFTFAEESLSAVIKTDSTIWQAYYYRGAARKGLKKFNSAEKDIEKSLRLHGDFYEGLVELAKILHFRQMTYESERAINKAIRLDRTRGTAYYLKGDINLSQNQKGNAIKNYKDCLASDSLFHDAHIKLALFDAMSKKDMSAALPRLNKVLEYDSLHKAALLFRSILGSEKNKAQSVKDLSTLLIVSPNDLMARFNRGVLSAEMEDFERAFNDFQKVIKATSTDDNNFAGQQSWLDKKIDLQNAGAYTLSRLYGLPEEERVPIKKAYCYLVTTEYDKAIKALDEVKVKKEPVVVYLKAVAFEHKGAHPAALQHYTVALEIDNSISDAYKKRGIYRQEMKQWENSITDFTSVLKLFPEGFLLNRMRGVSYYHLNRFDEAISDYNIYLRKDSTNKEVIGYRGMAYLKSNQRLKAYVDFAASENQQLLDFKDITGLIDSVLNLSDTTLALNALNIITDAAPYFTEGFVQKFKIHRARNNWKPIEEDLFYAWRNRRADAPKPMHSYLLTLVALSYSKNNHTDDAVKSLNEAIKFDEKNDFAFLERGRLYVKAGKLSKAQIDLRMASALGNQEAQQMLVTLQ